MAEDDWDKWARRAFAETAPGQLGMRYDPDIGIAIGQGKIKPSSMVARFSFPPAGPQAPHLLIRGALSDLVEAPQVALMRAAAPMMAYAEVPDVGHAPMLTEPQALAALREFLGRVD